MLTFWNRLTAQNARYSMGCVRGSGIGGRYNEEHTSMPWKGDFMEYTYPKNFRDDAAEKKVTKALGRINREREFSTKRLCDVILSEAQKVRERANERRCPQLWESLYTETTEEGVQVRRVAKRGNTSTHLCALRDYWAHVLRPE